MIVFRAIPASIIMTLSFYSLCQDEKAVDLTRKRSKSEFIELTHELNLYVPADVYRYPIIICKYSIEELKKLTQKAFADSYIRNGYTQVDYDTIYVDEKLLDSKFYERVYAKLERKVSNIHHQSILIETVGIDSLAVSEYPYVLQFAKYSDIKSPYDIGWTSTMTVYFRDRRIGYKYLPLFDLKYDVIDLMKLTK